MLSYSIGVWKEAKRSNRVPGMVVVSCQRKAVEKEAEEAGKVYRRSLLGKTVSLRLKRFFLGQKTQARRTRRDSQTLGVSS